MNSYKSNVFHRNLKQRYPTAVGGKGVYIYDEFGQKYLDGSSGALVSNVGHGNEEIITGILEQIKKLEFAHTSQFRNKPVEEYAELISKVTPKGLNYTYFLSGGSEANETAIKMARQYFLEKGQTTKHKVIGRWASYHGNTLGTLSAGGHTKRRKPHVPLLNDFSHIESPDWYRTPKADPIYYAKLLEKEINRQGADQVAAFIIEPVTGSSNAASYGTPTYYKKIREICDKYEVILICDEVMSGFGRTGRYFACEHFGFVPDIITAGKGISGGYSPLAAVIVEDKIFRQFLQGSGEFMHGHTYIGNPISTRAGLETLKYLMKYDVLEKVTQNGDYLIKKLEELKKKCSVIGEVRGIGLMIGIEIVGDKINKTPFHPNKKVANKLKDICFKNGLIVYPGSGHIQGIYGDTILIAPPFIITNKEIDELVTKLTQSINELLD